MLQSAYPTGEKCYLLYKEISMSRMEGLIITIHIDLTDLSIEMQDGLKIALKDIIAFNGVFLPECGECKESGLWPRLE